MNSTHRPIRSLPPSIKTHLNATLQQIDEIANEDVEMQGPPQNTLYIVLDTNVLLHHFEVIQQFIADIETQNLSAKVVIPGAVIYELDGQKNRDGLAWFARRASAWLLKKVRERRSVKGQAQEETCKSTKNWKVKEPGEDFGSERTNDYLIFDCCRYFSSKGRAFLCSGDNNLCLECEAVGVPTIQPSRQWKSREIAYVAFGQGIDLSRFGAYHPSYRPDTAIAAEVPPRDDDGMDIDDEDSDSDVLHPSHTLDLLHIQVIEHFTRLLIELVARVGGLEVHRKPSKDVMLSQHAPRYSQRELTAWTAADCLEYLDVQKPRAATSPRLDIFLALPYAERGARRGHDWPTQAWAVSLGALGKLGERWEEMSIQESLKELQPHLGVFNSKMRPTGM